MTPKMLSRCCALLLVTSLLTATVVGQSKSSRPPIAVPDSFRGADSSTPSDQSSLGDSKWFEVFKDEELQKLVRAAIVQNYDVRLAVARINAARANVGLARSDQFPQIVGSLGGDPLELDSAAVEGAARADDAGGPAKRRGQSPGEKVTSRFQTTTNKAQSGSI